jgi:hypothetical protein
MFWLNGEKILIPDPDPSVILVDYLHGVGLVGTKAGCGQGGLWHLYGHALSPRRSDRQAPTQGRQRLRAAPLRRRQKNDVS